MFVEKASLEHSQAEYFDYFLLTPWGFDVRVFTRSQLIAYFNEKNRVRRQDGTYMETYKYPHGACGDQADNEGVFVPKNVVNAEGLAPYQYVQQLRKASWRKSLL